jgi:hypothetical protein
MNIDTYSNFQACLAIGQIYEQKAIDRLMKYFDNEFYPVKRNDDYRYDFKLSNNMSYEVKSDMLSRKTNNIYRR